MKPGSILSEMEREPVIFFGCTWSEVTSALRQGLAVGALVAVLTAIGAAALLRIPAVIAIAMCTMMAVTFFATRRHLHKIADLRAGRPLFYERHAQTHKNPKIFIQPARRYQRERNTTR